MLNPVIVPGKTTRAVQAFVVLEDKIRGLIKVLWITIFINRGILTIPQTGTIPFVAPNG